MRRSVCEAFVLMCFVVGYTISECPDGWVVFRGSCYLFSHDPKTFTEAEHFCLQRGSHLVHINTNSENVFVKGFCRELIRHNYWIGLTDADVDGIWIWKDTSEEASFTDFYPGEPNNGHVENCVDLWANYDFRWNDDSCNHLSMPICEKKISTEQAVIG